MPFMNQSIVDQFLIPFLIRFFFVFGIVGFVVGVGLVLDHVRMHRLSGFMNQWVSMRHSTKWLAVPRDIGPLVQRFRHLIGTIFILLAAFSTFVLMTRFDADHVAAAFDVNAPHAFVVWIVDAMRWLLIAGGMLAIVVGVMLMVSPNVLRSVEARTNRWVSFRTHSQSGDAVHAGFDKWVESYPRAMGSAFAVVALAVVVVYGLQLFARH
jgi:hypothetical protein